MQEDRELMFMFWSAVVAFIIGSVVSILIAGGTIILIVLVVSSIVP